MNLSCVICTETVATGELMVATQCGHMFHKACLNSWLVCSQTCPQCRAYCMNGNIRQLFPNESNEFTVCDDTDTAAMKTGIDVLQNVVDTLQIDKATLQTDKNKLQREKDTLQNTIETLQVDKRTLQNDKEKLQDTIDTLQSERGELRSSSLKLTIAKITLQKDNDAMKLLISQLQEKVNQVSKELNETERQVSQEGKGGGATMKSLRENNGPKQEAFGMPLRISGDPQKVELLKELFHELIAEDKQDEEVQLIVPKAAVGLVIGKNGEMIKMIQMECRCKLQFMQSRDQRCLITATGTKQHVEQAKLKIQHLIESVMRGIHTGGKNIVGHPVPIGRIAGFDAGVNAVGPREEVMVSVPEAKCGNLIGRNGESIKRINLQSGAYCVMARNVQNPPNEKIFKVKGTSKQIEHARKLISDKIGVNVTEVNSRKLAEDRAEDSVVTN